MDTVDRTGGQRLTRSISVSTHSLLLPNSSSNSVPIGLKILALASMVTAIILIGVSAVLLSKTHETLVKWLKAAPATMSLLGQVNDLLGGTTGIVEEVESQEKYLQLLIACSFTLVVTGVVQLCCNIWFFCRMNASCIASSVAKSEQFFCGI